MNSLVVYVVAILAVFISQKNVDSLISGRKSQSLSISQKKGFLCRRCLNGTWDLQPTRVDIQTLVLPQDPEGFLGAGGTLCYSLGEEDKLPPNGSSKFNSTSAMMDLVWNMTNVFGTAFVNFPANYSAPVMVLDKLYSLANLSMGSCAKHFWILTHEGEILSQEDPNFDNALVLTPEWSQNVNCSFSVTLSFSSALVNQDPGTTCADKVFCFFLYQAESYEELQTRDVNQTRCVYRLCDLVRNVEGSWKEDDQTGQVCQCKSWRTTHFGLLLLQQQEKYEEDSKVLQMITLVTGVISLASTGGIFLTAILFRTWRNNTGNRILLNLSLSIILHITIFFVTGSINRYSDGYAFCTVVGMLLHYSTVSQFCWMLVIAVLQYQRFVKVFVNPPSNLVLKTFLFAWGVPLVPVLVVFLADKGNYARGTIGLCYPTSYGLYFGVWAPLILTTLINLYVFVRVMYSVVRGKSDRVLDVSPSEVIYRKRLAVLLFFMLGFTWVFGLLAETDFGETFIYFFCLTVTSQGFVLFLYFIIFNSDTRKLYVNALKRAPITSRILKLMRPEVVNQIAVYKI